MKDEFIKRFRLPQNNFSEATPFTDGFGFSTSKDRKQDGQDFASLYKFFIRDRVLNEEGDRKPITISVSYGNKNSDGSITLASSEIQRKLDWPIELISNDEFFFDISTNKFYYQNKEFDAFEILLKIESWHMKPTKPFSGGWLRLKLLFYRIFVTGVFKLTHSLLISILYLISGTKTTRSIWFIYDKQNKFKEDKDIKIESFATEKINIFGYAASAWSVVVYSLLHLVFYTGWYFLLNRGDFPYFLTLFKNGFLTIVYVIPTLVFFERLIPQIFKKAIIYIGEMHMEVSSRKIPI